MLVTHSLLGNGVGAKTQESWLGWLKSSLSGSQSMRAALETGRAPVQNDDVNPAVKEACRGACGALKQEGEPAESATALKTSMSHHRAGLTLVETLVCIGIAAILMALIIPAVQSARQSARDLQDTNNLKQIGLALQSVHEDEKHFPNHHLKVRDAATNLSYVSSPYMKILPYLEGGNEVNASVTNNWYAAAPNNTIPSPKVLQSPNSSSNSPYRSDYVLIVGDQPPDIPAGFPNDFPDLNKVMRGEHWFGKSTGVTPVDERLFESAADRVARPLNNMAGITDGTSHTVVGMLGWSGSISDGQGGPFTQYVDAHWNNPITAAGTLAPGYFTAKLAQETPRVALGKVKPGPALFADGHVQRIGPNVDSAVLRALATRNKGESIPDF